MRLLSDASTPFGRKVMVAALERGIPVREEFVSLAGDGPLDSFNPLRQIPVLVTDDGDAVFDSSVILAFLDTRHDGDKLLPADPGLRVATRVALADGLIEATLQRIMEVRRPAGEQSPGFVTKLEGRIARALAAIDRVFGQVSVAPLCADAITIACALDYVDFRYNADWRATYPALSTWQQAIAARPSMQRTKPGRITTA